MLHQMIALSLSLIFCNQIIYYYWYHSGYKCNVSIIIIINIIDCWLLSLLLSVLVVVVTVVIIVEVVVTPSLLLSSLLLLLFAASYILSSPKLFPIYHFFVSAPSSSGLTRSRGILTRCCVFLCSVPCSSLATR